MKSTEFGLNREKKSQEVRVKGEPPNLCANTLTIWITLEPHVCGQTISREELNNNLDWSFFTRQLSV